MKVGKLGSLLGIFAVSMLFAAISGCSDSGRSSRSGTQVSVTSTSSEASESGDLLVLSNRPDLISGGNALIEVLIPDGVDAEEVSLLLGNVDVTSFFRMRDNNRFMGLLSGLSPGDNVLTARYGSGGTDRVTITNHSISGPIFSGPQIQPWACLDGALDEQCNRPITYEYLYKSSLGGALQSYDPDNPPNDVSMTTTDHGKTVPFIVRVEKGVQNRGQYQIAVLFDPDEDWQPWAPQEAWNGKTVNHGGSGCGARRGESETDGQFLDETELSLGFLTWETALSHNNKNCNMVVQAESLMMAKEHIVEAYGPIRYTIGMGGSGGSIKLQQAANAFPGIFDGIVPSQSFTDTWSTGSGEVLDCRYLVDYFDNPLSWALGVLWTLPQRAAVMGHPTTSICESWIKVFSFDQVLNPRSQPKADNPLESIPDIQDCNVPEDQLYDPNTNPEGVRCSLQDYMVNVLGRRAQDGFAKRPHDNVGVQYGLEKLLDGTISVAQFLDLNQKIGSRDIDYNRVSERAVADPNVAATAYRGGLFNQADHMHLPIIDIRGNDNEEIHHNYHSHRMRARLVRSNGHHDNQAIWVLGPIPSGDSFYIPNAFRVMDQWLAAMEADASDTAYEERVIAHKPAGARDLCTDGLGNELSEELCAALYTHYAEPRVVAGSPTTGDIVRCQLKPLSPSAYPSVTFTAAQWAQMQSIFPNGVCDYSQPGPGRQPTKTWLDYSFGPFGQPLPEAATPFGWAAPVFRQDVMNP